MFGKVDAGLSRIFL